MKARAELRAVWRGGVRVAGAGLGLDVASPRGTAFLSSAAAPLGRARQVIATATTLCLAGAEGTGALAVPLGRPFALGALRLELFPSGLCPGAAGLLVERRGFRLAYAGRLGAGHALAEAAEPRPADVLVIDAGRPLPARAAALAAVRQAIDLAREAGETPVLVASPFLAGAELAALLAASLPLAVSRAFAVALRRLAGLGHAVPAPPVWRGEKGVVVLAATAPARPARVLSVGAAADADLAWPEVAGGEALATYARAFGASRVYVTSSSGDLPAIPGAEVVRLGPPEQLSLDIG